VYAATYNAHEETVSLNRLLYIGEAANVGERIRNHGRRPDWTKKLRAGEVLCFSIGRVESTVRERAEAALIFKHKPPLNTSCTAEFNYDRTTMSLSGRCALLVTDFTVERTVRRTASR
jgi:excinuclease UvrABC nuclease subunit